MTHRKLATIHLIQTDRRNTVLTVA